VRQLSIQCGQDVRPVRTGDPGRQLLRPLEHGTGVRRLGGRPLVGRELGQRVAPYGLQLLVPDPTVPGTGAHVQQAPVHQGRDLVEDVLDRFARSTDGGDEIEVGVGYEYAEPAQQPTLGHRQPADAAVDRDPQRVSTRRHTGGPTLQVRVDSDGQFSHRQQPQVRGDQLDAERQPVEEVAEPDGGRSRLVVDREIRPYESRPVGQQLQRVVVRERSERDEGLVEEPEPLPAGRQDPHARASAKHRGDIGGRLCAPLLAAVENEQPGLFGECVKQASAGVAGPGRRGHRIQYGGRHRRTGQSFEWHPPDLPADLPGVLDREPALARAGRTDDRHQARPGQRVRQRSGLAVAADPAGRDPRQRRPLPGTGRLVHLERGVLGQDPLLEPAQRRTGVDTELVGQQRPRTGVGVQRVGLPAAAIEGQHEELPPPLAQRLGLDERAGPGQHAGRRPGSQGDRDLLLAETVGELAESLGLHPRCWKVRDIGVRRPAETIERRPDEVQGARRVGGGERSCTLGEPFHHGRIDGVRCGAQRVAAGNGLDHQVGVEGVPEAQNVVLEGVAGSARRFFAPHRRRKRVNGDRAACVEDQRRAHRPLAAAAQRNGPVVVEYDERTEHARLHMRTLRPADAPTGTTPGYQTSPPRQSHARSPSSANPALTGST